MKKITCALLLLIGMMSFNTKKAEAGVAIFASGGVTTPMILGFMAGGGGLYLLGEGEGLFADIKFHGLIVLAFNEKEQQTQFPNIPDFVLQEAEMYAQSKANQKELSEGRVTEIVLTHQEVDEIFSLMDDSVPMSEKDLLRTYLTEYAL